MGNAYLESGLQSALYDEEQKRQLVQGTISRETVRVILQEHGLKPWQEKMWCIAELDDKVTACRDGLEFSIFLTELAARYASAEKIVLVMMDNLSTHSAEILKEHMGEELAQRLSYRFEIHYTPKHASWLNPAEIAIAMYSRQCPGDGRVGDIESLKTKTAAWNKAANRKRQLVQWRLTRPRPARAWATHRAHSEKLSLQFSHSLGRLQQFGNHLQEQRVACPRNCLASTEACRALWIAA